jgi:hypothetical protein
VPARSTTVTPDLQRRMIRDTAFAILTTPRALVVWGLVAVVFLVGIGVAATGSPGDAPVLLIGPIVFAVLFGPISRRSVRRAILAALPVGSTVRAELRGETLHLRTPSGVHDVALSTYRKVIARPSVVLLHLRGSQIFTALPRDVFAPEDLERLRAGVESPVGAP